MKTLHGVSAFGTHLYLYRLDTTTKQITPLTVGGVPPIHQWDCDLLAAEGSAGFARFVKRLWKTAQARTPIRNGNCGCQWVTQRS